MGIRIIQGRAGSGKSRHCLWEIKEALKNKEADKIFLIVPEQYTFQAERELLEVLPKGGILGTEVLSFRRLAYRIFSEEGGMVYPALHPAGKAMLLYRLLDKRKNELKIFAGSAERRGFIERIVKLISEFKRYGVSPEAIKEYREKLPEGLLGDKLEELAMIYQAFEEEIREKYQDPDDDLSRAALRLASTKLYKGALFWVDGFSGFTPQEYKLLQLIQERAERVTITVGMPGTEEKANDGDVFAPVRETLKKLSRLAGEEDSEEILVLGGDILPRFENSPALAFLERNYFSYSRSSYAEKPEGLAINIAPNPFAEIEAIATQILNLVREGRSFKEIGLLVRNLKNYEGLIEIIFEEYGIPYYMDRKEIPENQPLIRTVLAVLDIFVEDWSYEAVFSYLKAGFSGLEAREIYLLENYVLACGIKGKQWRDQEDWQKRAGFFIEGEQEELDYLTEINRLRRLVSEPLLAFRKRTKGRRTAAEFGEALFDFLTEIKALEKIERELEEFRLAGKKNQLTAKAQIWNVLMRCLDQLVEAMSGESFGIEKFANLLRVGLAEYKIGTLPLALDQVLIGSVERSRSHPLKILFIPGVNDGVFPSIGEEGVLRDEDRRSLKELGLELAGDTRTQAFEEQYLLYRALTIPEDKLILSYPLADGEGKTLRPSLVISRIKKLFPKLEEEGSSAGRGMGGGLESIVAPLPAFRQTVRELLADNEDENTGEWWREAWSWFGESETYALRMDILKDILGKQNQPLALDKKTVEGLFGKRISLSVSRLEKYAACPFSFFVQYGLRSKERKIYSLSPPDIGSYLHFCLELFSRRVEEEQLLWAELTEEWREKTVAEVSREILERMKHSALASSPRYLLLAERLKRVLRRAVEMIVLHFQKGSFEPLGYEMGFGEGADFPPLILEVEEGKVVLNGKIDRVDILQKEDKKYLRVIDYKSGQKDFKLEDVYLGLELQLLTYLFVLREELRRQGEEVLPGGVLYFRLQDPLIRIDGPQSEAKVEELIRKQLKMKGLLLADLELIRGMEKDLSGSSTMIPVRINKDGKLGKSSVAVLEDYDLLQSYVREKLLSAAKKILHGNIEISPYRKKGKTPCKFCDFKAVCQFDPLRAENKYRVLGGQSEENMWREIRNSAARGSEQ